MSLSAANVGIGGGAIFAASSYLKLNRTTYVLHCSSNGGTALLLQRSSGIIDTCHFGNNLATAEGVVSIEDSQLSIISSVFKENNGIATINLVLYYIRTFLTARLQIILVSLEVPCMLMAIRVYIYITHPSVPILIQQVTMVVQFIVRILLSSLQA